MQTPTPPRSDLTGSARYSTVLTEGQLNNEFDGPIELLFHCKKDGTPSKACTKGRVTDYVQNALLRDPISRLTRLSAPSTCTRSPMATWDEPRHIFL